ncbi:MAG: glycoside hydrolase family 3 C-terminal domain-containing protein [Acholeplasmataceae bacterium]|jgi:uncharacterized repeat protein (TIGR02543 family)|nr:glycoside hydrolase family 3 C-terminal domain-containing protein [Acholeplasmataceae bacterium]
MSKARSFIKKYFNIVKISVILLLLPCLISTTYAIIFESDFTSLAELQQEARELNAEVTADSVTLLKNIGNSLPLEKGNKVTVFGVFSDQEGTSSSNGFAFGGQGSGNGSDPLGYVSLHDGLEAAGLAVNPTVKAYYASSDHRGVAYNRAATVPNQAIDTELRGLPTGWTPRNNSYSLGEEDPDGEDGNGNLETVKSSFGSFNDAAIIVIRRTGSEGGDYSLFNTPGHSNPLDHYYQPDDNELALIDYADQYFENVVVLINSANPMELTDVEDNDKVDAILWIGYPGGSGNIGVGKVIAGEIAPSGRTVDLYGADFKTDPAWQNFAGNIQAHLKVEEREMIDMVGTNNWVRRTMLVAVAPEDPWTFDGQGNVTLKDPETLKDIVPTDGTTGTMGYRGRPVIEHFSRITDMNGTLNMPQAVSYSSNSSMSNLLDYEEGIYMGYRFYETAAHEGYFDGTGEEGGVFEREEAGYYNRTDGVLYPFGYGLSYTNFRQEFVDASVFEGKALDTSDDSVMEVEVKVTNIGDKAGKEAVQLYVTVPYTPGGIEKSYVSLIAFGKTGLIEPGKSETITLTFNVRDLASFDWNDANEDGHKGYELDPGDYVFRLQKNSHEEIENFKMTLADIVHYDKDAVTGADITPLFSPDDGEWDGTRNDPDYYSTFRNEFVTPNSTMVLMTREDFEGTFPEPPTPDDLMFSDEAIRIMDSQAAYTSFNDLKTDPWYVDKEDIPETWTQASAADVAARVNGKTAIQLWEMADVAFDDPQWDEFINQLTWTEMQTLINNSAQNAVSSIGRPQSANADGPGAFPNSQNGGSGGGVGTHWCAAANLAATFNVEYAEAVGRMEGNHSLWNGAQGWYGPAIQMHRVGPSGRNFEYFSQDPLLTGMMGAYQVKGATSTGTIVYMKHLFLNEQETSRYTAHTFADEQTAREIYGRAFEMAIKYGNANSTMSAYPSSGLVHPTSNYYLYEKLLHDEWGFVNYSITDYFNNDNTLTTANMSARSNQVPLNSWQTNFGRNMDGVWDEEKNVLVVTMPEITSGYNPQNVNAGASRAYKDELTGEPASKIYMSDAEALEDGFVPVVAGDTLEAYTQWAAYRNLIHRILYTTVNSNVMKNGLVSSPWSSSSTGTVYAPIGLDSNASVAGDQVLEGFTVNYTLKSGTMPDGLTFNTDGSITGKATTAGTYRITVGAYLPDTNWVGLGGGNNTYQRNFDIKVEPLVSYEGDTDLVAGVPFTGQYVVNPNFLPLPAGNWVAAFRTSPGTSWISHQSNALPTGITLTAIGSSFSDPESEDYGKITISGTPTTPVAIRTVYFYLGTASWGSYIGTVYGSDILSFTVAGNYNFDMNYEEGVDIQKTFLPGEQLVISNPSRDGYVFGGWYTDELTTTRSDMLATTAADTTLYARWIDINNTTEVLAELSLQISNLLENHFDDAEALEVAVQDLQEQINDVLAKVNAAEPLVAQIPSIQASIDLITESLVALTGDVDAEFAALTEELDVKFGLIDQKFIDAADALETARLALEAAIAAGDTAGTTALTQAIATLEAAIEAGDATLAGNITTQVNTITALITAANERIDDAEDRLDEAETALEDAEGRLDDLEADLAEAESKLQELIDAAAVEPETGCGSSLSIGSTLFITFSLILGSVMLFIIRRKR